MIAERREAAERAQAAQAAAKGAPGQPMRIRNDYVPRAQAKRQSQAMGICPNCKQQVPVDEMSEHMKSENAILPQRSRPRLTNDVQLNCLTQGGRNSETKRIRG